jgi:hypothetical protein
VTGEVIILGVIASFEIGQSSAEAWRFQGEEHTVLKEETRRSPTERSESGGLNKPGMSSYRLGAQFVSWRQAFRVVSDIWHARPVVFVSAPDGRTVIGPV